MVETIQAEGGVTSPALSDAGIKKNSRQEFGSVFDL